MRSYLCLVIVTLLMVAGCSDLLVRETVDLSGAIETYRVQLERRLLLHYNQSPEYAGKIDRVEVVVGSTRWSVNNDEARVEFNQLVFDKWNERVEVLELEYYIVNFGRNAPHVVKASMPRAKAAPVAQYHDYGEHNVVHTGVIGELQRTAPTQAAPISAAPQAPVVVPSASTTQVETQSTPVEVIPQVPPANVVTPLYTTTPQTQEAVRAMKAPASYDASGALPKSQVRNLPLPTTPELD